jgi:flavin-dependent dehydrogenase
MTGPGWCLVGDSGFHLDPMSALGAHAVLSTVRLLRDRVAGLGQVSAVPADYADLGARRDALLTREWDLAHRLISVYEPGAAVIERARQLAEDADAVRAEMRTQMGLPAAQLTPARGAPPAP